MTTSWYFFGRIGERTPQEDKPLPFGRTLLDEYQSGEPKKTTHHSQTESAINRQNFVSNGCILRYR